MKLVYRDNMTPEELAAFMAEIKKEEALYASLPPDTGERDEETEWLEELNRGYNKDRI